MEATAVLQRSDAAFTERRNYEASWKEIRDFIYPEGPSFDQQEVPGQSNRDRIVSNIGETTLEDATSAAIGLTVNRATEWKRLAPIDPRRGEAWAVRGLLFQANKRMLAVYNSLKTRFYKSYAQVVREYLAYGTGCLYCGDRPGILPLFIARPLAQMAFAENDDFEIDEAHWRFQYTARQALQRWGERLGPKLKEKAASADKGGEKSWFRHCVWPDLSPGAQRPYREYWVSEEDKTVVAEGSFTVFPYVVARENQRPGEIYGRGRGIRALADIKMFQRVRRSTIQGAEKTINPPMMIPDEGVVSKNGQLSLRPAAPNYIRADYMARGATPQPILTNSRVDLGLEFEQSVKGDIGAPMLAKVLNLPREPRMPTSHVLALEEEAMRTAAPIVEDLQTEALAPIDAWLYLAMQRDGAFDDIFPAGMKAPIETQFDTPASKIARLRQARALAQRLEIFMPVAQARPDLLDLSDWPTAYREVGDILGVPPHWDHDPDTAQQMTEARNQAAQEQAQQEAAKNYSTAGKNIAPLLKVVAGNAGGGQQGAAA